EREAVHDVARLRDDRDPVRAPGARQLSRRAVEPVPGPGAGEPPLRHRVPDRGRRVAFRVDAEDDERRPPGRTQPLQDEGEVTTFDRTLGMTPRVEEGQEHGPSPKRGEREARAALVAERELRRGPLPGWPAGLAVERRRGFRAARATQLVQRD